MYIYILCIFIYACHYQVPLQALLSLTLSLSLSLHSSLPSTAPGRSSKLHPVPSRAVVGKFSLDDQKLARP